MCKIVGIGASLSFVYIAGVYRLFEFADRLNLGTYWQQNLIDAAAACDSVDGAVPVVERVSSAPLRDCVLESLAAAQAQWRQHDRAIAMDRTFPEAP